MSNGLAAPKTHKGRLAVIQEYLKMRLLNQDCLHLVLLEAGGLGIGTMKPTQDKP